MKTGIILRTLSLALCLPIAARSDQHLSPQQRLDLLPLPADASRLQNVDFTKDPLVEFSQQHRDFRKMNPYSESNGTPLSRNDPILGFTTYSPPRMVYLFFRRFFHFEIEKITPERKLPFYNGMTTESFDAMNEADVSSDKTIGNAAFYRIDAGQESRLCIVIFNNGTSEQTTVYVIASQEPPAAPISEPIEKRDFLVLSIESTGAQFEAAVTQANPQLTGHVVLPKEAPSPSQNRSWLACDLTCAEAMATLAKLQAKELLAEGSPVRITQAPPIHGTPAEDVVYQVPDSPTVRAGISSPSSSVVCLAYTAPDRPDGYRIFMIITK